MEEMKDVREHQRKQINYWIVAGMLAVIAVAALSLLLLGSPKTKGIFDTKSSKRQSIIVQAERLADGFYYDEALAMLQEDTSLFSAELLAQMQRGEILPEEKDGSIEAKLLEIQKKKDSLVKYQGPMHHVFFHSLIVYPQLAFDDKGHPAQGYNMWMTTVSEFKKMLPRLYEKGYILYPIEECYEEDPDCPGQVRLKDIYLPEGRIPLVLSIDDVNYYDYMKPDGFANRLVLGKDGRVWTEVVTPDGEITQTRDGDVMPILDDYVEENPGFSWRGAKGIMALTGYQGALGYRITDDLPQEEEWKQTVTDIANVMRSSGWSFACHSYTHNSKWFREGNGTLEQVKYDTDRWKQKIAPYVGETKTYISPFGFLWKNSDPRYRYIIEQGGYQIFCPVGNGRKYTVNGDNIVMPRVNLDGYTMSRRPQEVADYYFVVDEVIDKQRPPL